MPEKEKRKNNKRVRNIVTLQIVVVFFGNRLAIEIALLGMASGPISKKEASQSFLLPTKRQRILNSDKAGLEAS